jgi:hypothetical protein
VTGSACGLWHTYHAWRYTALFYSLLLTLAIGPLRSALGIRINLLEPLFSLVWLDQAALIPIGLALWTVVALLAAASAVRFVLRARVVEREHLYAGLSAYLLAGIFFGVFYWVIEHTWADSFAILGEGAQGHFSLTSAIYYSFVTLATLGYGDIVPRSEVARGLAIVEAVAGQLYLAVMIARLVSLYVVEEGKGNHSPKVQ